MQTPNEHVAWASVAREKIILKNTHVLVEFAEHARRNKTKHIPPMLI